MRLALEGFAQLPAPTGTSRLGDVRATYADVMKSVARASIMCPWPKRIDRNNALIIARGGKVRWTVLYRYDLYHVTVYLTDKPFVDDHIAAARREWEFLYGRKRPFTDKMAEDFESQRLDSDNTASRQLFRDLSQTKVDEAFMDIFGGIGRAHLAYDAQWWAGIIAAAYHYTQSMEVFLLYNDGGVPKC